jgi:hypothetical protein
MKRNLSVSFTLAVAATLVVLIANPAYAVNCNNATLTGSYGVITALGLSTPGPAKTINLSQDIPSAVVGVVTFDGTGSFTDVHTFVLNGVIFPGLSRPGTYTVNSDCTGSMSNDHGVNFNIVIVSAGTEIFGIVTNPGRHRNVRRQEAIGDLSESKHAASLAKDYGYSVWLDANLNRYMDTEVGYTRSAPFNLNTVSFSLGFNVARLAHKSR